LLLAAIGLYGVLTRLVGQQIPEIGLRLALGAAPKDVVRRVAGQALGLTVAGLTLGVAGAFGLSGLLTSLVFGVTARDPATYAMAAAVLLFTAALATWVPLRRALRVDPMVALRGE
jgi:ABC-type antimicrobial peptide transport system permease subunit